VQAVQLRLVDHLVLKAQTQYLGLLLLLVVELVLTLPTVLVVVLLEEQEVRGLHKLEAQEYRGKGMQEVMPQHLQMGILVVEEAVQVLLVEMLV
jgi:hypothetical protein